MPAHIDATSYQFVHLWGRSGPLEFAVADSTSGVRIVGWSARETNIILAQQISKYSSTFALIGHY